ncbi:MAG TPA: cupin domain-containing protein [Thermomicrobiales bacterium]|nr:cupin domain-containing protein [Thermomicrobiales bacterium]
MTTSGKPTVSVTRSSELLRSKQGLQNIDGVSAEMSGSTGLWLGMIRIPPGARANAHFHEAHETAIYVLEGSGEMWYGDELQEHMTFTAGDFIYIPAGVPHVPANPSATDYVIGIAARTDPNEQESVILAPELERFLPARDMG